MTLPAMGFRIGFTPCYHSRLKIGHQVYITVIHFEFTSDMLPVTIDGTCRYPSNLCDFHGLQAISDHITDFKFRTGQGQVVPGQR